MVRIFRPSIASLLGAIALLGFLGLIVAVLPSRRNMHPNISSAGGLACMIACFPIFGIFFSNYIYRFSIFYYNKFRILSGRWFIPNRKSCNLHAITAALETQRSARGSSSMALVFRESGSIIGRIEPGMNGWTERAMREIYDVLQSGNC